MTAPLQSSMQGLNLSSTARQSTKDWTLPPAFLSILATPPHTLIPTLVPAGKAPSATPAPASPSTQPSEYQTRLAAFIPAMQRAANTLTAKGADAHSSTNDPLVNLFFEFTPGVTPTRLFELIKVAWKKDALITLRIIFHARSIHEGKGWKEGFYRALGWVWDNHPRTLLENLHLIVDPTCERQRDEKRDSATRQRREAAAARADNGVLDLDEEGNVDLGLEDEPQYPPRPHGSFNDLIELLKLHLNGQLSAACTEGLTAINEGTSYSSVGGDFKSARLKMKQDPRSIRDRTPFLKALKHAKADEKKGKVESAFQRQMVRAPNSKAKHALLNDRAAKALTSDRKYQALYVTVLHIFSKSIKDDLSLLAKHGDFVRFASAADRTKYPNESSPHLFGMSYAAKWVPSPGHSADKQTLFATALAKLLFPNDSVNWARHRLQKEVLAPLRKVLSVPEVKMSNGSWNIDFAKVPAKSMARNAPHFYEHNRPGFDAYLQQVQSGRSTISGASLMPHEILFDATQGQGIIQKKLADLQWESMVNSIRISSRTRLENCIAIADVSGSMGSLGMSTKQHAQPILPCVALTLLLGELATAPWSGSFFTFSATPRFETVDTTLPVSERANSLSRAEWEMSTNFFKVFDMILAVAEREKLAKDQMVKKLFVFSDMQFDKASDGKFGETEHQTIKRKFEEAGYTMPQMVCWNLAGSNRGVPAPVTADVEGVSLFSGFSGSLMKFFLGRADQDSNDEDLTPDIGAAGSGTSGAGMAVTGRAEKKKPTPSETLIQVTSAESLSGLKVVD